MPSYKTKVDGNVLFSYLSGELDSELARQWVDQLEKEEASAGTVLHRFHDVRDVNAVHLSFDDLWSFAQRRMDTYVGNDATKAAFWVSTPLNYGVSRMYQALTDGTPFEIEVLYELDEIAEFLGVELTQLENFSFDEL